MKTTITTKQLAQIQELTPKLVKVKERQQVNGKWVEVMVEKPAFTELNPVDKMAAIVKILFSVDLFSLPLDEGKAYTESAAEALKSLESVVPADTYGLVDKLGTLTFGHYVDLQQTNPDWTEADLVVHTLAIIDTDNSTRSKEYPAKVAHYYNQPAAEVLAQAGFFMIIAPIFSAGLELLKTIESLPSQEQQALLEACKSNCLTNGDITALSTLLQVETYLKKKRS